MEALNAFTHLNETLLRLSEAVLKEPMLCAWTQETGLDRAFHLTRSAREKTIFLLQQLHYLNHQAPRDILVCPGFIGASSDTLILAQTVNDAKERFKQSMLALKEAKIPECRFLFTDRQQKTYFEKKNLNTLLLKNLGLSRLHLKQCYRTIPILPYPPSKISWTWAHTRAIKKISIAKARILLEQKGQDIGIQLQLQKLNRLSEKEPLAIVQELAPHLRANIVFPEQAPLSRLMIKGPLPIFYPCDPHTQTPQFKAPMKKTQKNDKRIIRSDVKIDPIPFLPAIHAHRYILEPV